MQSEHKVEKVDYKKMKKESKKRKTEKLIKTLDKHKLLQSEAVANSAKPVPKNILSGANQQVKGREFTVRYIDLLDINYTSKYNEFQGCTGYTVSGRISRVSSI